MQPTDPRGASLPAGMTFRPGIDSSRKANDVATLVDGKMTVRDLVGHYPWGRRRSDACVCCRTFGIDGKFVCPYSWR
jgi:hypothetical protein